MSSDLILSSPESEKRWVLTMKKMFPLKHHSFLNTYLDAPSVVFKVPKHLTQQKPEAYAPRRLGLGPYHHLRPHLYKTHAQKLAAIRKYLSPEKLQDFQQVVEGLIPLEPLIRASYDQYLDLDIDTLAWILAIDGLYLLQFLNNYSQGEDFAGDVMMLENQIPAFLLRNIQQCVGHCPSDVAEIDESSFFENFLRDQSPLKWNPRAMIGRGHNPSHLLQCLYHLIVFKERPNYIPECASPIGSVHVEQSIKFLADRGLPGASTAGQILSFLNKIPWNKFFKKGSGDEQTPSVEKIDVPSVSKMRDSAGVKFVITQGIWSIRFEDSRRLHLPVIRITGTSEVVLRNLVAYEEASGSALVLAAYLDLMCGIIDGGGDVRILREEKIIDSELGDEEISGIFNGISRSSRERGKKYKSNVDRAIDKVNARYNKLASVRAKAFVKKSGHVLFRALGELITIHVLILLVLRAFCSVFGCGRWFGKSPGN